MSSDDYPNSRPRQLKWLAARGLCDPESAAEHVWPPCASPEAFAQARNEYQRATANYPES
jgi:hypothetical protein